MPLKLTRKDFIFILLCVILSAVCLFIGINYFYRAFPEASIDFKVTRDQSFLIAEKFIGQMGWELPNHQHASLFTFDDDAKTFLEKEMGLEKANQLLGSHIKIWRWSHRWFRPLEKEEGKIEVSTTGEIVSFQHQIEEAKPGARLDPEQAREVAENFLANFLKKDLSRYEFVEVSSESRPNRTDHSFTWQEKGFDFQDSQYRFEVRIQGNEVGAYNEYLKVPEKWTREYQKLRSHNNAAGTYDSALFVLLLVGMLVVLVQKIRLRDIHWKVAFWFGAIGFALGFLSGLNSISLQLYDYETTQSYSSFITQTILGTLGFAFLQGAAILFFVAGAEPIYRENFQNKISFNKMFLWQSLKTKHFFKGLILGFTLTFFFFAYQIVFYLLAGKFGAWSPADVPYSNMLNTKVPWVFVLLGGFSPAVIEETVFRMFAIPFIKKIVKSFSLAIILAGFIWGFGHASYPNQPWFIRGVEVGLAGIIMGIIMIKVGILPALVWHYTVDALYTSFLLLRSGNTYFIVSGVLTAGIMFIPLLVALFFYYKNKGFQSEENLTNEKEGIAGEEHVVYQKSTTGSADIAGGGYQPLPGKHIWIGVAIAGLLLMSYLAPREKFGDFVNFQINNSDAINLAKNFLKDKNGNAGEFRVAAEAVSDYSGLATAYIFRRQGIPGLNRMFGQNLSSYGWKIRFYKPLQKEEWQIEIDPNRKNVTSFRHIVAEDSPGADLSETQALILAMDFLKSINLDPSSYALKENTSEKKKNRRDYKFTWEYRDDPAGKKNVDELKYRLIVELQGDRISYFKPWLKVPEEFEREFGKQTVWNTILSGLRILAMVTLVVWGIWTAVVRTRGRLLNWKSAVGVGLVLATITLLIFWNFFPLIRMNYPTTFDENTFFGIMIIEGLILSIGVFLFGTLVVALVTFFYPNAWDVLQWRRWKIFSRDAVITTIVGVAAWMGFQQLRIILVGLIPNVAPVPGFDIGSAISTSFPFVEILLRGLILGTILRSIIFGTVIYFISTFLRNNVWRVFALFLFSFAVMSGGVHSPGEFLFSFGFAIVFVAGVYLFTKYFLRNNPLAYFSLFLVYRMVATTVEYIHQGQPTIAFTGQLTLVLLILWIGTLAIRAILPLKSGK